MGVPGALRPARERLEVVSVTSDVDGALTSLLALTDADEHIEDVRRAALAAESGGRFSASEVVEAVTELGLSGVSVEEALAGALDASLRLAEHATLDVAVHAVAWAMATFDFSPQQADAMATVILAQEQRSPADVVDLLAGLRICGMHAAQAGVSFNDLLVLVGALCGAGFRGEKAGYFLRRVLTTVAG